MLIPSTFQYYILGQHFDDKIENPTFVSKTYSKYLEALPLRLKKKINQIMLRWGGGFKSSAIQIISDSRLIE